MKYVIGFLVLLLSSCKFKAPESSNDNSHLRQGNAQPVHLPDSIPGIAFLDSVADANMEALFDWDAESAKQEKNLPNEGDLELKINRKVDFSFDDDHYRLIPFFRKGKSGGSILILHFLLVDEQTDDQLMKKLSFHQLTRMNADEAYYLFQKKKVKTTNLAGKAQQNN